MHNTRSQWFWPLLAATCLAAWGVYLPGLGGGFLFDDWINLDALGAYGPVDSWAAFLRYITSGAADPTGRPLALLSFLLDARDWPAAPLPFKRTNVILHLVNGGLLALLLRRLGRATFGTADGKRADIAAVLGSAFWLLHPLLVSTTLYVVQREAMLPVTFILLGLFGYVAGRERILAGYASGWWLAVGSIVVGTTLATAAKANGALLPLLALTIDWTLLHRSTTGKNPRLRLLHILLAIPSAAIIGYLVAKGVTGVFAAQPPTGRPWTVSERLLTEPRVLLDYLRLLIIPQPYSTGLFNDQIVVSRGLFTPRATFFAILLLASVVTAACLLRRRLPIVSAAILFYMCGHLLESTSIPLELYFEHRNYLPALLLFWPLGWWLAGAWGGDKSALFLRWPRRALSIALPALLAILTLLRCSVWGNTTDQALLWAKINQHSPRAQAWAAQVELHNGYPDLAIERIEQAMREAPNDVQLPANLVDAYCARGQQDAAALNTLAASLQGGTGGDALSFTWLSRALDAAAANPDRACPDITQIGALVVAWSANPRLVDAPGRQAEIQHLNGRILLLRGHPQAALAAFDQTLKISTTPATALRQAAALADAGHPELALKHLQAYQATRHHDATEVRGMARLHQRVLARQHYWGSEFAHLERALQQEVDLNTRARPTE